MQRTRIQNTFFFLLLLLTTLAFVGLIRDFLQPLFWAAVLATIFHPVKRFWSRRAGHRESLASVLTLLTILFIVILPLFLIGLAVARESVGLYNRIVSGEIDLQEPVVALQRLAPVATEYLDRFGIEVERITQGLSGAVVAVSRYLASQALSIGQNALWFTLMFFIMLYLLFFFLRDGEEFLETIIRVLPLGDVRERRLFGKFAEVSRATIKGTLIVGLVQGALGGLLFWILGIGAPFFWGVIMTLVSILPALGAAVIWLPAAIILMITGEMVKGIILIVAGTLVIGLVDNLLRPILVGRDTRMPDWLILLSTLGGLAVFGISGFVIGPIIAAFFLVVWKMFEEEYGAGKNVEEVKEAAAE